MTDEDRESTLGKLAGKALPAAGVLPVARATSFPIVAMGASAGGLEAFSAFFKAMPSDGGMAFVLVVHLDPTHTSLLPELIQRCTAMPVRTIVDGAVIAPNTVYVIPPGRALRIEGGVLRLSELPLPRGVNLPIDIFFRSLAADQGARAICVIMSGTGTDGTLGLKAIKGETGMVMVEDGRTAQYPGMIESAIATGLVDYIAQPEEMPAILAEYTTRATRAVAGRSDGEPVTEPDAIETIFGVLRTRTRNDFSLYKRNTIYRRIERRMFLHQMDRIADYANYLHEHVQEADLLFRELLIGVTNFFRDPEAFQQLRHEVLPVILADKPDGYTFRVWAPGCSTGEEAYSLAIVLHECLEMNRPITVQIFGTDLDARAIERARTGLYPASIAADISPQRLARYFTPEEGGHYRVRKHIREMLIFAPQNVVNDPPFTRLDLLSCRNLLIYLGQDSQRRLYSIFQYALKPRGILFLGTSESIGQLSDNFEARSQKWRIFQRKSEDRIADRSGMTDSYYYRTASAPAAGESMVDVPRPVPELNGAQLAETILMQSGLPPCIVIDESFNLLYVHGHLGRFLEIAQGLAQVNALKMARHGVKSALAAAAKKAIAQRREVVMEGLRVEEEGGSGCTFDLVAKPLFSPEPQRSRVLVTFLEAQGAPKKSQAKRASQAAPGKPASIGALEQELVAVRESLQITIEELEASNEELRSTNEELQSTNEELQSSNEELETSREELQSLNEESSTVNAELQSRIQQLSDANDDMKNLLDSMEIAILFLDTELRVRRFTPGVADVIPLSAGDVGRPLEHFATKLVGIDLTRMAADVLAELTARRVEAKVAPDQVYAVNVRPYRTVHSVVDGVVFTFDNISQRLSELVGLRRLALVVQDSNDAVTLQRLDGTILSWNQGAERLYGYTAAEALDMNIAAIVPADRRAEVGSLVKAVCDGVPLVSHETVRITKDGRPRKIQLTMTLLKDMCTDVCMVATTERDLGWAEESKER